MPNWKEIGKHQQYIMWAEAYGWLPSEVDEQDPEIMAEIQAFRSARSAAEEKYRSRK